MKMAYETCSGNWREEHQTIQGVSTSFAHLPIMAVDGKVFSGFHGDIASALQGTLAPAEHDCL
jgi:hypothetical protein